MRILFILFVFLISTNLKGQEWSKLSAKFYEQVSIRDFEKALVTSKARTKAAELEYGEDSYMVFSSKLGMAQCLFEIGQLQKSKDELLWLLEFGKRCNECKSDDIISVLILLSIVSENLLKYEDAIRYSKQIILFYELDNNIYNSNKFFALKRIGKCYIKVNSFLDAEKYFLFAIEYSKTYGISADMVNSLTSLGILYLDNNRFEDAYKNLMASKEYYEGKGNMNIKEYCVIISYFKKLYGKLNKRNEGITTILNILKNDENTNSLHPKIFETCTEQLGEFFIEMEEPVNAIKYFELSLKGRTDTLSISYANTKINLGMSYEKTGKYDLANKYLTTGLNLLENNPNSTPNDLATAHNNLGVLYSSLGQYEKAEKQFKKAVNITEENIGTEINEYGSRQNNLAEVYTKLAKFELANNLYLESIQNAIDTDGKSSVDYIIRTMNYAIFLQNRGQLIQAQNLYMELVEMPDSIKNNFPNTYSIVFTNAATLLMEMGRYEDALNTLLIEEKFEKENSLDQTYGHAILLSNIANCYSQLNEKNKALEYATNYLSLTDILFGQKTAEHITALELISNIYFKFNQIDIALNYIESSYNIYKLNNIQLEISSEFNLIMDYAIVNWNLGNISRVSYLIEILLQKLKRFEQLHLSFQSEKELENLMSYLNVNYDLLRNLCYHVYYNNVDSTSKYTYNIELFKKNLIISTISTRYGPKTNMRTNKQNDYLTIKKLLKPNQVAIEFSSFQYRTAKSWTDSILYIALIMRHNDSIPLMVTLCEQKQLDSIFVRATNKEYIQVNNIYKNKRLYELIWKPIEKHVMSGDQIYFSPSGSMHQISLGAIADSDSTYLSDRYIFNQVGSTGVLASEDRNSKPVKDIAIFGGIDFDASDEQIASAAKDVVLDGDIVSRSLYIQDSTRSGKWTYLNGTQDEAQSIDKMAKSRNIESQLFTGSQAIEERFKSLSGKKSPSVIHIATHGFFFPDPKVDKKKLEMMSFQHDNTFTLADNPMNRSGLLMAGGNKAWIGDELTTDREDGILTAYEVSNMSLFNTELVVLSACETGLGDIMGSEGVYGLQRAFKQAGVKYLMMSLWKVPDNATKEFMITFYTEYLTNQKTVREAFNTTQTKMKNKYRNEPYKWGGFILME